MKQKKKILGIILALCLVISTCALVACNNDPPPEGGAWYAQAKISGGTATLTFTSDTEWKLDCKGAFLSDDWNPWQSGTYKFDGKPGASALHMTATKESPNTFIKDKEVGEEATYEPKDGIYTIVFDVNGKDSTFSFKPPQDGTKPDGTVPDVCTNHVDNNCDGVCDNEGCDETVAINHVDVKNNETQAEGADGKCDTCGNDMPAQKSIQVTLSTDALGGGAINLYSDKTFDFCLTYGGKILEGTWASSNAENLAAPLTLTVDKSTLANGATESPVGDTLTVNIDASAYPVITYTCSANYDATAGGQGVVPMTFTGTLGGQTPPDVCTNHVDNNCDGVCDNEGCDETLAINHVDLKNSTTQADGADGKCDKCGNDMPVEKTVLYSAEAPVYAETMKGTLKIYEDNSWEIYFGGDCWCNGTWSMDNTSKALTLVRTNTASGVSLVGAVSETVTYQPDSGVYTITMNFPSKDGVVFTINVGGDEEPCTNHVDEKNNETQAEGSDGKCDKCGENMPIEQEKHVLVTMNATDTATTMVAEIKMYADGTFDFVLPSMVGKAFGGTWASTDSTGANPLADITLTVDNTGSPVVGETITVTITPNVDYSVMTYSCHIDYVVTQPHAITMNFDFTGTYTVNS